MSNIKSIALFAIISGMIYCQPDPYRQGHVLYQVNCENCHMEDGSGLSKLIPSLQNSEFIISKPDSLVCLIRHGIAKNPYTGQEMPPIIHLNDVELTNLINYMRDQYTDKLKAIKVSEVHAWQESCP